MDARMTRYLMRNPRDLMNFHLMGRLPQITRINSPLISLIESIPRSEWERYRNIKLTRKLGYITGLQFNNLWHLYRWLKPHNYRIGSESIVSENCHIKGLTRSISLVIFIEHCS